MHETVKHLKVLGRGDPNRLANDTIVRQLVTDLVCKVGMQPLGDPTIHNVPVEIAKLGREPFEDEGGVTAQLCGFHTLSTSHVAVHTWPARGEFHLDLYSCREFEQNGIGEFIKEVLHAERMIVTDLTFACEWDSYEESVIETPEGLTPLFTLD